MADQTKYKYVPMYLVSLVIIGFIIYLLATKNGRIIESVSAVPACESCTHIQPTDSLKASTGRKRALLFGCNYNFPGSFCLQEGCVLFGCIQDVKNISVFLQSMGFAPGDIQMFVDDGSTAMPTKSLIKQKMQELVSATREGDVGFVWYSGHGAQISNPSVAGGYNECWCPPDTLESGQYLTDITLNSIVKTAVAGSTIFVGSDSCHSGTVFDIPYFASPAGLPVNSRDVPPSKKRATRAVITEEMTEKAKSVKSTGTMNVVMDANYFPTAANVISLSGCQDWDTSADAYEGGSAQGAMTWAFLSAASATTTLSDLLFTMRTILSSNGFSQVPQLSFGTLFDPNTTKIQDVI